ncbi:UDP-glucose 4-epimerase GalE [Geothrix sp. PMB-07]|uniref:UDP-glucose 4-epimerase GalE n=1 Tax=Geothrix sp. PMB-07 TaxID=3068640 RepID=UPI002741F5B8|nr:UDP-glucose 4-epimerase GalE [Geothrix sp. PMB-07]WLT31604.1 UDP-glucose 4-epimerase GalE [Geothrix sp. PMB-07]
MTRHVLITGGAGFIGSHTVDLLIREGYAVTVLDSLEKGHRSVVHPQATFVQGDCGDAALLDEVFAERAVDAVLHFAAYIEAGESMQQPERFFVNNTARPLVLLDAMLRAGVKRFVFSSTAATYGEPQYTPIDEAHPQQPTNAYGYAKLLVEGALDWMHRLRGLSYAALRYFNAAGCSERLGEDHHPETHLIPLILDVAAGRRASIKLFGEDYPTPDGTCIRDYIHVEDLASAHLLALRALEQGEGQASPLIYNLGNGQGYSVREVVEVARKVTGHPIPVEAEPRRAGDPAVLVASSDKIRRELGWVPRHPSLEAIVQSAWDWRRQHPEGYAD